MGNRQSLPQAMRPSGFAGRIFGWLMARLNQRTYRWVIAELKPAKPKSALEIGFGTGHMLEMALRRLKLTRVAGRDPSALMLATAQKRLKRFRKKAALDLALGDDTTLPDGPFDAILALHSFQFWSDPHTTLTRLQALTAPYGRLVLVLRRHFSGAVTSWLPNPISKSADEIQGAIAAAEAAGFRLLKSEAISSASQGLVFDCG